MLLIIACSLAVASAAPSFYDQRQDGNFNLDSDFKNFVILIGLPKKVPDILTSLLSRSSKRSGEESIAMDRSDTQDLKAFVEPNTPYQVEIISEKDAPVAAQAGDVEVVIAGRRRLETEPQHREEMKLIGATEQCGPDRVRDPVTLTCRARKEDTPEKIPEVIPVLT